MGVIRLCAYGSAIYVFYILAFPGWTNSGYHFVTLAIIFAAAFGVTALLQVVKISSLIGTLMFEFCFALAILLYVGWTMPQASGKPPIQQWVEGHHPNQAMARQGAEKLGLDPKGKFSSYLIKFFPKK